MTAAEPSRETLHLLPEDADERRMFDAMVKTMGDPLQVIANALYVQRGIVSIPGASFYEQSTIQYNEIVKAADALRRAAAPAGNAGVRGALEAYLAKLIAQEKRAIHTPIDAAINAIRSALSAPQLREAFADEIKRADAAPPEASFDNASDMLEYLNAPAREAGEAIKPRRPFDDKYPDGYRESDDDWIENNKDAVVAFLERSTASPSPIPDAPVVREEIALHLNVEYTASKGMSRIDGWVTREQGERIRASGAVVALKPRDGGESGR